MSPRFEDGAVLASAATFAGGLDVTVYERARLAEEWAAAAGHLHVLQQRECAVIAQVSREPCLHGVTFGCSTDGSMWIRRGCRGRFACGGQEVRCGVEANENAHRDALRAGTLWRGTERNCSCAPAPPLPFYIYSSPLLDHSWLESCPAFDRLYRGTSSEKMAEVGLLHALREHPRRVDDPAMAKLFYVGVYEYASYALDRLHNCSRGPAAGSPLHSSHHKRMDGAMRELEASPYWQRCKGCDHVFASSATDSPDSRISVRMHTLSRAFKCSAVGRYKPFVGGCQVVIPYDVSEAIGWSRMPGEPRPILVQFAGSLDVCCTGVKIRCAIGELMAASIGQTDVLITPSKRSSVPGPCLARALAAIANRTELPVGDTSDAFAWPPGAMGMSGEARNREIRRRRIAGFDHQVALKARASEAMAASVFCLVPAGDTFATSRLYSAIATGCLPVLLGDGIEGALSHRAHYDDYALRIPQLAFEASPHLLVPLLRSVPAEEILRRQTAMLADRPNVLYNVRNSRVGTHFLDGAARCLPAMRACFEKPPAKFDPHKYDYTRVHKRGSGRGGRQGGGGKGRGARLGARRCAQLVLQKSRLASCEYNVSFGCASSGTSGTRQIWVSKGCRGVFKCRAGGAERATRVVCGSFGQPDGSTCDC